MEVPILSSSTKHARKECIDLLDYICGTCASQNRVLHQLDKEAQEVLIALTLKVPNVQKVCWECLALLKNAVKFRRRAWQAHYILSTKNWKSLDIVKLSRLTRTKPILTTTPTNKLLDYQKSSKYKEIPSKCVPNTQDMTAEKQDGRRKKFIIIQRPSTNEAIHILPQSLHPNLMPQNLFSSMFKIDAGSGNPYTNIPKNNSDMVVSLSEFKSLEAENVRNGLVEPTMTHKTIFLVDPRNPDDKVVKAKVENRQTKSVSYLALGPTNKAAAIPVSNESKQNKTLKVAEAVSNRVSTPTKVAIRKKIRNKKIESALGSQREESTSLLKNTISPGGNKSTATPEKTDCVLKFDSTVRSLDKPKVKINSKMLLHDLTQPENIELIDLSTDTDETTATDDMEPVMIESQNKTKMPSLPCLFDTKLEAVEKIGLVLKTDESIINAQFPNELETQPKIKSDKVKVHAFDSIQGPNELETQLEIKSHKVKDHAFDSFQGPNELETQPEIKPDKVKDHAFDSIRGPNELETQPEIKTDKVKDHAFDYIQGQAQNTPERLNIIVLRHLVKHLYSDINMESETISDTDFTPDSTEHEHNQLENTSGTIFDMEFSPVESLAKSHFSDTETKIVNSSVLDELQNSFSDTPTLPTVSLPENTSIFFGSLTSTKSKTENEAVTHLYQPKTLRYHSCIALNIIPENNVELLCTKTPSNAAEPFLSDTQPKTMLKQVIEKVLDNVESKPKQTPETPNNNKFTQIETVTGTLNCVVSDTETKPEQIPSGIASSESKSEITSEPSYQLMQFSNKSFESLSVGWDDKKEIIDDGTELPTIPGVANDEQDQSNILYIDNDALEHITKQLSSQDIHLETIFVECVTNKTFENIHNNTLTCVQTEPQTYAEMVIDHLHSSISTPKKSTTKGLVEHPTAIQTVNNIMFESVKANLLQPVMTDKISKAHCSQTSNRSLKNIVDHTTNSIDIISDKSPKTVSTYRVINTLNIDTSVNTTSDKDLNAENMDALTMFDLPLYCAENIPENVDLLEGNVPMQKFKKVTVLQPISQEQPDLISKDNMNIIKKESIRNTQPLLVRRITAENSSKFNLNREVTKVSNSSNEEQFQALAEKGEEEEEAARYSVCSVSDGLAQREIAIEGRSMDGKYYNYYDQISMCYLTQGTICSVIFVSKEYKHIEKDHCYCTSYVFSRIAGTDYKSKAEQKKERKLKKRLKKRVSLKQQMAVSEGYLKNVIQDIVDSFETEDSNALNDQECLNIDKMNNRKKESLSRTTTNNVTAKYTEGDISKSICIDIKVEPCDINNQDGIETDGSDWSTQECQTNLENNDIQHKPTEANEDSDTDTASETSLVDKSSQWPTEYRDYVNKESHSENNYIQHEPTVANKDYDTDTASDTSFIHKSPQRPNEHRDYVDNESDSENGDSVKAPPGYICDDSLQDYTDYELQPIESTGNEIENFDNNLTICFSTAVFDSELNEDPVYYTDNTKINNSADANFNTDEFSRNSSPNLLEPLYYTDWEDTTYAHVLEDHNESNAKKKKYDLKNKQVIHKIETNKKKLRNPSPKRKRKRSEINISHIDKPKTKRVSKRVPEDIQVKLENDLDEKVFEKLLMRPVVLLDKIDAKIPIKRKRDENIPELLKSFRNLKFDPIGITEKTQDTAEDSDQTNGKSAKNEGDSVPAENCAKRTRIALRDSAEKQLMKRDDENKHVLETNNEQQNNKDNQLMRKNDGWRQQYAGFYTKRTLKKGELEMLRAKTRNGQEFMHAKYKCEKCVRVFPKGKYCRSHMAKYHGTIKRTFVCKICECSFDVNKVLKLHVTKHTKCFSCFLCNSEEYLYLRDLIQHVKIKHKALMKPRKIMNKHKTDPSNKQYICGVCRKTYENKFWLDKHLRNVHKVCLEEEIKSLILRNKEKTSNRKKRRRRRRRGTNDSTKTDNYTEKDLSATETNVNTENSILPDSNTAESNLLLSENSLNTMENTTLPDNNLVTTESNFLLSGYSLSTTENDLSLGASRLSGTENDLSLAESGLSATENDLSLADNRLSATENDLSLVQSRLSASESGLSPSAFQPTNRLSITQNDLNYGGDNANDAVTASEIDLSSSERNLNPTKKDGRDLICIDNNMIVMDYSVDITEKEFLPQKKTYQDLQVAYNNECSTGISKDKDYFHLMENTVNQYSNKSNETEIDINSMGFTILGLQPTSSGQDYVHQSSNNIFLLENNVYSSENNMNMSENYTISPENDLNLTENTLSTVENDLCPLFTFSLDENSNSSDDVVCVIENNLRPIENVKKFEDM